MRTPPTSARSPEPPTAKSERTQTSGKTLQPLWSASRSLAREERCQFTDDRPLGIHDPAAVEGTDDEKLRAFNKAFRELDARLKSSPAYVWKCSTRVAQATVGRHWPDARRASPEVTPLPGVPVTGQAACLSDCRLVSQQSDTASSGHLTAHGGARAAYSCRTRKRSRQTANASASPACHHI